MQGTASLHEETDFRRQETTSEPSTLWTAGNADGPDSIPSTVLPCLSSQAKENGGVSVLTGQIKLSSLVQELTLQNTVVSTLMSLVASVSLPQASAHDSSQVPTDFCAPGSSCEHIYHELQHLLPSALLPRQSLDNKPAPSSNTLHQWKSFGYTPGSHNPGLQHSKFPCAADGSCTPGGP